MEPTFRTSPKKSLKPRILGCFCLLSLAMLISDAWAIEYWSLIGNGTAFRDKNGNGKLDKREPSVPTGADGRFDLPAGKGAVSVTDGNSRLTGLPNALVLSTFPTATSVGVLTSSWKALLGQGVPNRKIAKLFAIPQDVSPLDFVATDIWATLPGSKAELLLKREAQLSLLAGAIEARYPFGATARPAPLPKARIIGALAVTLNATAPRNGQNIDLGNADTVKAVILKTLRRLKLPALAESDLAIVAGQFADLNAGLELTGAATPALFAAWVARGAEQVQQVEAGNFSTLAEMVFESRPVLTQVYGALSVGPAAWLTRDKRATIIGRVGPSVTTVNVTIGNESGTADLEPRRGYWSYSPSSDLADGTYNCTATATDQDGATSESAAPLSLTIDTTPPAAAVVETLVTNDITPQISGTWDPTDNQLVVTVNGQVYSGNQLHFAGKGWSLTIPANTPLAAASYDVGLKVTDRIGNATAHVWPGALKVESPWSQLFTAEPAISFDADPPLNVKLADFNNDTKLDIAAVRTSGQVALLLGNGDGSFQAPVLSATAGAGTVALSVGHIDGDAYLDLVTGVTRTAPLLYGNGDGSFDSAVAGSGWDTLADMNGDGHPDLVGADYPLTIYLNNGMGGFPATPDFSEPEACAGLASTGDLNGDGKNDFVVENSGGCVSVRFGNGDGTLQPAATLRLAGVSPGLGLADLDSNGSLDIVLLGHTSLSDPAAAVVFLNDGNGHFDISHDYPIRLARESGAALTINDFDGDGEQDLAIAGGSNGHNVVIMRNTGGGHFGDQIAFPTGDRPVAIDSGDINGDGKPDLVVANATSKTLSLLINQGLPGQK